MITADSLVHEMKGTQFPFGVLRIADHQMRKSFVKKRYYFKDQEEYQQLRTKIDKLKNIAHRNTVNLRFA